MSVSPADARTQVRLRVWGATTADAQNAEASARQSRRARSWTIVEVIESSGPPCPIPSRDPLAIEQATGYDGVWAVYPNTTGTETS